MSSGFRPAAYSIAFEPGWPMSSVRRALTRLILTVMTSFLAQLVGEDTEPVETPAPSVASPGSRALAAEASRARRRRPLRDGAAAPSRPFRCHGNDRLACRTR